LSAKPSEDRTILIESGYFNLPGKKLLLSNKEIEMMLTDGTETAVQRPKKRVKKTERATGAVSKESITVAKRKGIP
jgi:hypothetical protein